MSNSRRTVTLTGLPGGKMCGASSPDRAEGVEVTLDETLEKEFFYGRKSPGKGGGETPKQWFRIHEFYVNEAKKIIELGLFPAYETRSDLYVHAVVRHIRWLATLTKIEGSILSEIAQIDEITSEQVRKLKFSRSIDAIGAMVADVLEMPDGAEEAARMLTRMARHISRMRLGFWRGHYEKLFFERFGPYMEEGSPMFLFGKRDTEEDEEDDRPFTLFQVVPEPPEEEMVH